MGPRAGERVVLLLLLLAPLLAGAHFDVHPKSRFPVSGVRVLLTSSAVLAPNVTTLTAEGQRVAVAVSGVDRPLPLDMVAVYAPPTADPTRTVPLAWLTITHASPEYTETGAGSVVFTLSNHRADMVFRLLRNGTNLPGQGDIIVEGRSPVVKNALRDAPTQGHLALDATGRYLVQWVSGSRAPQTVQWGPSPGALGSAAPSTTVTYTKSQMCGTPANGTGWLDPGFMHTAAIPQRPSPGARVFYRFGSDATGWSQVFSFRGAPAPGGVTKVLVFNDVGMTNPVLFNTPTSLCPPYCPAGFNFNVGYASNSSKLVPHLSREDADVALMIGDLSYAQGFAADWDVFGSQFEPAFTRWPVMVGTGNHERDWPGTGDAFQDTSLDSGGECNVPFSHRYATPASYPRPDPRTSFYSFDVGAVHFLVLDSEVPSGPDSPQGRFAAADLAKVDRRATPWVVAGMHRMMAAPSLDARPVVGDQANMARMTSDFEDLFSRNGVALVLTGHEHAYARTCALLKGRCVAQGGITHIMAGNAGAGFTHNFPAKLEPWVMFGVQDKNGYVRLTAGADVLLAEAVGTDDGRVFDRVRIPLPPLTQSNQPVASGGGGGRAGSRGAGATTGLLGVLSGLFRSLFAI
ncbi:MAG: Metallo-dependent phosphatase-like protein [Monoraphidium minutum]|nr:MAG: Metallo-dependent phosphatase-like protein [Monoraphidium minutum]